MSGLLSNVRKRVGLAAMSFAKRCGAPVRGTFMAGRSNVGYEAGQYSSRDPDFPTQGLGPNLAAERGSRDAIVARSRYLTDNNETVDGAVGQLVSKVVGRGIGLNPATGLRSLDDKLRAIRDEAFECVDPERSCDIFESQAEFYREIVTAGECGVYLSFAPPFVGKAAGPAIELFATERVPMALNGIVPENQPGAGNAVRQGVEYDSLARRTAFWVLREDPIDGAPFGPFGVSLATFGFAAPDIAQDGLRRLPVPDARLCYRKRRTGQLRGVPRITSGMRTIRTEEGYTDNNMLLAELIASLGVYFAVDNPPLFQKTVNGQAQQSLVIGPDGQPVLSMRGARIMFVPKGSEPKVVNMAGVPGPQFEQVIRAMQRRISRCMGLAYAQVSGDSSQDTFASRRGDEMDNRDLWEPEQLFIYKSHSRPHYERVVRHALFTGRLQLDDAERKHVAERGQAVLFRCVPVPGGFEYVNPAQEAAADEASVRTGSKSRAEIIRGRGRDPIDVIREEAEYDKAEQEIRESMGLGPKPSGGSGMSGNLGGDRRDDQQDEPDEGDEQLQDRERRQRGSSAAWSSDDLRVTPAGMALMQAAMNMETGGRP